jgi:hypothetical protein
MVLPVALELVIVAAGRVIDGQGSLCELTEARGDLEGHGARVVVYRIAPMSFGWHAPLPDGYLKSACAPIEGLISGGQRIAAGELDAVMIHGSDQIKSEFADKPAERHRLMQAYGGRTFVEAFDDVAAAFRERMSISIDVFDELADCLFENYWATWTGLEPSASRPDEKWFSKITPHFRGVDCANPSIDFEGALLVTTKDRAFAAGFDPARSVLVKGLALKQCCEDGIEHVSEIVTYDHLKTAYTQACAQANVDVGQLMLDGRARIEIYSCFPVVPIGFLLATGLAADAHDIKQLLRHHPVTITGGLNLGRAPWNNSTLSAMVHATEMVREGTPVIGVHSNAALGYKQGFAVLGAPTTP